MKRQAPLNFRQQKNVRNGKAVLAVVANKPLSLNTRILRALQSKLETKRYFVDSNITPNSTNQLSIYVNPLAGIVNGSNPNQRVGDQITLVGIEYFITYEQKRDYVATLKAEANIVRANTSGTFTSASVALYTGASLKYTGFPTNGPDNKELYQFLHKKQQVYRPENVPIVGTNINDFLTMSGKLSINRKIQFTTGSAAVKDGDYLIHFALDQSTVPAVAQMGFLYFNYIVYYKDA